MRQPLVTSRLNGRCAPERRTHRRAANFSRRLRPRLHSNSETCETNISPFHTFSHQDCFWTPFSRLLSPSAPLWSLFSPDISRIASAALFDRRWHGPRARFRSPRAIGVQNDEVRSEERRVGK